MINRLRLVAKAGQKKGSCLPSSAAAQQFNFDELAKEVAQGLSRRKALKLAFTGLAGAALASLGIKPARADVCYCPSTDCTCTDSPWQGFGGVSFQCCCIQHDYCFTTCGSDFATCNLSFYRCLLTQCQALHGRQRIECDTVALLMYEGVSTTYPDSPSLPASGYSRFLTDQSLVCGSPCATCATSGVTSFQDCSGFVCPSTCCG